MSLAPASSRGIFLNARFAVNGIQCAARSFGTLTAGRGGLLSSIGASSDSGVRDCAVRYQLRTFGETDDAAIYCRPERRIRDVRVPDAVQRFFSGAPQSRDPG